MKQRNLLGRGLVGARLRVRGSRSVGARLRGMGRGNHAITALKVIKRNQVKMIKNS
jgi:hypothetical protein